MSDAEVNRDLLYTRVKAEVQNARHFPSGPAFKALNKQLAELSIDRGDHIEGIFHLTESLGVSTRLLSQYTSRTRLKKNVAGKSLDASVLDFNGPYKDVAGMMKRLKELPSEWTVVHITLGFDPYDTFLRPGERSQNLKLRFSLLPTGDTTEMPVVQRINYSARRDEKMPTVVEELATVINDLQTKPKAFYDNRAKYWGVRAEIAKAMERVIKDIEFTWLSHWRFLLLGNINSVDMKKSNKLVNQLLLDHCTSTVSDRSRFLLHRLALAAHLLKPEEVYLIVEDLLGTSKQSDCVACALIENFKWVASVARQPVVLIVDELLDRIPWENLSIVVDQPITRAGSLAMLHALFKVHEDSMEQGYKIIDSKKGYFVVNPQANLADMELRFHQFLYNRLPRWEGTYGKSQNEDFLRGLVEHDVFLYAGHGNGRDLLPLSHLEMAPVRAVALLMGCNSTSMVPNGGLVEHTSIMDCYNAAACPLVIGNLWQVTDTDIDRITTALLHTWTPLKSTMSRDITEYVPNIHSHNKLKYASNPDLLRALCHAKKYCKCIMTRSAIVARGLPVITKR